MSETGILIAVALQVVAVILLVILLTRSGRSEIQRLRDRVDALEKDLEGMERRLVDQFSANRNEEALQAKALREEIAGQLQQIGQNLTGTLGELGKLQQEQLRGLAEGLGKLSESNERKLEEMRQTVEAKLAQIQADNEKRLEEVRKTVDEKLHESLERRLGESFQQVSERLEQVHRGLGEMQSLASGVGDLKKILSNVKTRGTWAEFAVGNLLEQVLSPEQFERNVATKEGSIERVEFAIRLPGRGDGEESSIWLPVDAKFPKEDYERLIDASEAGDQAGVEMARRQLEMRIRLAARDISSKYLDPPRTTDFAIMYLPTEGLYAEVVRLSELVESIQLEQRIMIAGPSTFAALLNALQMGFRTLAIQQRSSEVWKILGAVKTDFGKFGDVLESVKKKIDQAAESIEKAGVRSRAISRKLRSVEALPSAEAETLLEAPDLAETETEETV